MRGISVWSAWRHQHAKEDCRKISETLSKLEQVESGLRARREDVRAKVAALVDERRRVEPDLHSDLATRTAAELRLDCIRAECAALGVEAHNLEAAISHAARIAGNRRAWERDQPPPPAAAHRARCACAGAGRRGTPHTSRRRRRSQARRIMLYIGTGGYMFDTLIVAALTAVTLAVIVLVAIGTDTRKGR